MGILSHLQPERVFHYFEALCGIPHGSGNTRAVSDYCLEVAGELGREAERDEANNVILRKPASSGYEQHPTVILQAHLDMVCEKEPGVAFDFATDGLRLLVEGDWVTADGTTLGGDDGIGVALILALLEAEDLPHPPLEALLTTDEETGMGGAIALDGGRLTGRRMINLDCDEEGVFTVGCAGGARARLTLPLTWAENDAPCWELVVDGLTGGHSGAEIHTGRQNANKLMGELLTRLPEGWRLVDMAGGQKDNVITSRCVCIVAAPAIPEELLAAFAAAHRTPAEAAEFTRTARERGFGVLIAAAGMAAHLAGAVAANTTLPVIGIPCKSSTLDGLDALLSTVQMPTGIPVATVAIGGAANAALLAAEILAVTDDALAARLDERRTRDAAKVLEKDAALTASLNK
ncbi:MAG: 5-(carboxyamino)imidazole ribonucleotide mutase [Clostridia bacterium]|nr:5-(carboxyamino)imidazole ribonucleotide mutase [Clostridia bacterium]